MNIQSIHEFDLGLIMDQALQHEDYEVACHVRDEVNRRRKEGILNTPMVLEVLRSKNPLAKLAFVPDVSYVP